MPGVPELAPSAVASGADGSPRAVSDPGRMLEWRAPFVLDLPRTLGTHARGRGDPATVGHLEGVPSGGPH